VRIAAGLARYPAAAGGEGADPGLGLADGGNSSDMVRVLCGVRAAPARRSGRLAAAAGLRILVRDRRLVAHRDGRGHHDDSARALAVLRRPAARASRAASRCARAPPRRATRPIPLAHYEQRGREPGRLHLALHGLGQLRRRRARARRAPVRAAHTGRARALGSESAPEDLALGTPLALDARRVVAHCSSSRTAAAASCWPPTCPGARPPRSSTGTSTSNCTSTSTS
jgi:hypothetical protein